MEYQKKKKQILSSVEYTSLLSLSLVQNKLERNFKSIVQALLLAQSQGTQLKEDLQLLANQNSREIATLHDKLSSLQKKIKQMQNMQQVKTKQEKEELDFESKTLKNLSEPKIKINLIQSVHHTSNDLPSSKNIENQKQLKQNQYQQLKQKINKLLAEQIIPSELDKKLNTIKDNINLIKAQLKILSNREPKSSRRVSGIQKIQNLTTNSLQSKNLIDGIQEQFDKQINNVHIQLNSMKLTLEQMKEVQGQLKRKDTKSHIQMDQLTKNHKKLEQRVQSANNDFQSRIKTINSELSNIKIRPQTTTQQSLGRSKKQIETKQNISPNAKNQINDRISKLQSSIQGLVTESQFKRFRNQIKDKISSLESSDQNIKKQLKQQVQMLTEILDTKQQQLGNIQRIIDQLKLKIDDLSSCCQRKNNISISRYDQLKKNLQNLREDLEFYKSMNQLATQTKIITQNQGQIDQKQKNDTNSNKSTQQLKKYLNRKLHDQRTYLLGLIRDLQKKSGGKTSHQQDILNLWDKLAEINLFLGKKANEDDIRKSLAFFQKKLASIYQRVTSSDQNNQDARIAKTNWFCLSCDKNLHNYQGKVGQHVVWDSLPIKPGHTKYYNKQEKKPLPTLKR